MPGRGTPSAGRGEARRAGWRLPRWPRVIVPGQVCARRICSETAGLLVTMGFRSASWPGITVKGQIRGSASARLGQVQSGSRRMRTPKILPTGYGGGAHVWPRLCLVRSEFDTYCRRAGRACRSSPRRVQRRGLPKGDDDPPAPLTRGIDRVIRVSAAVAVLAVAGIAAYVCYWHAYAVVRATARPGSPPGSSRPRSTAWSAPARCSPGFGDVLRDVALRTPRSGCAAFLRDCGPCC